MILDYVDTVKSFLLVYQLSTLADTCNATTVSLDSSEELEEHEPGHGEDGIESV